MDINGSILTKGSKNFLPLDTFKKEELRRARKLYIRANDPRVDLQNNPYKIYDSSIYNHAIINDGFYAPKVLNWSEITTFEEQCGFIRVSSEWQKYDNYSLFFPGSSRLIIINNSDFTFTGQFTIRFWIKLDGNSNPDNSTANIFNIGKIAPESDEVSLGMGISQTGYLRIFHKTGSDLVLIDNEPHFVELTRDSDSMIRVFCDGQSVYEDNLPEPLYCENFFLGATGDILTNYRFRGYLDEFEVYNGVCLHTQNYEVPTSPELISTSIIEREDYSGLTIKPKRINKSLRPYSAVYYNTKTNTWEKSHNSDKSTLPARGLLLPDNDILLKGIVKHPTPSYSDYSYDSIIPDDLTSNNQRGYWIRGSSEASNNQVFKCLRKTKNRPNPDIGSANENYWRLGDGSFNHLTWINLQFPGPVSIKYYSLTSRYNSSTANADGANSWKLKASNDGVHWDLIDIKWEFKSYSSWLPGQNRVFVIANNIKPYKYYQFFDISTRNISRMRFFDKDGIDLVPDLGNVSNTKYVFKAEPSYSETYYPPFKAWQRFPMETQYYYTWYGAQGYRSGWVSIDLGMARQIGLYDQHTINGFQFGARYAKICRQITKFQFEGSNNETNWDILKTVDFDPSQYYVGEEESTETDFPKENVFRYDLDKDYTYRYYRMNILESIEPPAMTGNYLSINALDLTYDGISILPHFQDGLEKVGIDCSYMASSNYYTGPAHYAFLRGTNPDKCWYSDNGYLTGWLQVSFVKNNITNLSKKVNGFSIMSRNDESRQDLMDFKLLGSNDGYNWTELYHQTYDEVWGQGELRTYQLNDEYEFSHYRLHIDRVLNSMWNTGATISVQQFNLLYNGEYVVPVPNVKDRDFHSYFDVKIERPKIKVTNTTELSGYGGSGVWLCPKLKDYYENRKRNWLTNNDGPGTSVIELIDPKYDPLRLTRYSVGPINGYQIISQIHYDYNVTHRPPKSWTFEGSYDGTEWEVLDTVVDNEIIQDYGQVVNRDIPESNYKYYKLAVTDQSDVILGSAVIYEYFMALWGINLLRDGKIVTPRHYNFDKDVTLPNETLTNIYNALGYEIICSQSFYNSNWNESYLLRRDYGDNGWQVNQYNNDPQDKNQHIPEFCILLPFPRRITGIGIRYHDSFQTVYQFMNYKFRVYGSTDGYNWDLLYEKFEDVDATESLKNSLFIARFENTQYYGFYKLQFFYTPGLDILEFYEDGNSSPNKPLSFNSNIYLAGSNELGISYEIKGTGKDLYVQNIGHSLRPIPRENKIISYFDFNPQITSQSFVETDGLITSETLLETPIDGPILTKIYQTLTINNGAKLTVNNRCRGLKIVVLGDCIINGILTMTGKGARYPAPDEDLKIYDLENNVLTTIPKVDGLGAEDEKNSWAAYANRVFHGKAATNGGCGGGGGGSFYEGRFSRGGNSTCYSGGVGAGSIYAAQAKHAPHDGGIGPNGCCGKFVNNSYYVLGGVGNPGGIHRNRNGTNFGYAPSGTGGLLILIVYGNLTLGSTGIISSNGIDNYVGDAYVIAGAGGSGGGSVNIFHRGTFDRQGTIQVNGGLGNSRSFQSTAPGGNGGAGSVTIKTF